MDWNLHSTFLLNLVFKVLSTANLTYQNKYTIKQCFYLCPRAHAFTLQWMHRDKSGFSSLLKNTLTHSWRIQELIDPPTL